jgi:hypothetical protein
MRDKSISSRLQLGITISRIVLLRQNAVFPFVALDGSDCVCLMLYLYEQT